MGMGGRISDAVAFLETQAANDPLGIAKSYYSKTAHPRFGSYRNNTPAIWRPTATNGQTDAWTAQHKGRPPIPIPTERRHPSYSHEFVGTEAAVGARGITMVLPIGPRPPELRVSTIP